MYENKTLYVSDLDGTLLNDSSILSPTTERTLNELIADETGQHNVPANLATLDAAHVRFEEVIDNSTEDIEHAAAAFLGKTN